MLEANPSFNGIFVVIVVSVAEVVVKVALSKIRSVWTGLLNYNKIEMCKDIEINISLLKYANQNGNYMYFYILPNLFRFGGWRADRMYIACKFRSASRKILRNVFLWQAECIFLRCSRCTHLQPGTFFHQCIAYHRGNLQYVHMVLLEMRIKQA